MFWTLNKVPKACGGETDPQANGSSAVLTSESEMRLHIHTRFKWCEHTLTKMHTSKLVPVEISKLHVYICDRTRKTLWLVDSLMVAMETW